RLTPHSLRRLRPLPPLARPPRPPPPPPPAMPPSPSAATEAAAPPTPAARLLRTRFIDHQVAPAEVLSVHRIDRAIRFFVICNFDEGESARLAGEPVANQINCRGIDASLCEKIMQ